jgi:hypothetical protein
MIAAGGRILRGYRFYLQALANRVAEKVTQILRTLALLERTPSLALAGNLAQSSRCRIGHQPLVKYLSLGIITALLRS